MNRGNLFVTVVASFVLLFAACAMSTASPAQPPSPAAAPELIPESELREPVFIRDRTGRVWDVTHARDVYDMNPHYFNYGLGVGAIPSVDSPTVLEETEPGYPSSNSQIKVFGIDHNGEQRAYSVSALTRHEVFNDVYPGESNQYLAVTY